MQRRSFCQDPLEVFIGKQHAQGGCNDNPTSHQFLSACQYEFRQLWQQTLHMETTESITS